MWHAQGKDKSIVATDAYNRLHSNLAQWYLTKHFQP